MKKKQPVQFVVCLNNDGYPASLEVGKLYRFIPDEEAAAEGLMRVIDESGEDYLYPKSFFLILKLPTNQVQALEKSMTAAAH